MQNVDGRESEPIRSWPLLFLTDLTDPYAGDDSIPTIQIPISLTFPPQAKGSISYSESSQTTPGPDTPTDGAESEDEEETTKSKRDRNGRKYSFKNRLVARDHGCIVCLALRKPGASCRFDDKPASAKFRSGAYNPTSQGGGKSRRLSCLRRSPAYTSAVSRPSVLREEWFQQRRHRSARWSATAPRWPQNTQDQLITVSAISANQ